MAPQSITTIIILTIFTIASGILPAIFWLWFWLKEDRKRPEPTWMIINVFLLGGVMVIPAFLGEKWLAGQEPFTGIQIPLLILLGWAAMEEVLKYLAAFFGAFKCRYFDEPVDAMIYMITAALGFAAVENTMFIFKVLGQDGLESLSFLVTGNFRFIGATVIHIVASALAGSLIGLSFYQSRAKKIIATIVGLVTAIALHTLFNYSIIYQGENRVMTTFVGLWLAAILIILLFERVKANIIKIKASNNPR